MENKDINTKKISLLDLVDKSTLEYLLVGFCEKFESGMKIIYRDSDNEFQLIREIANTPRLWSEICKTHRTNNDENSKLCDECDIKNAKELFYAGNPEAKHYRCDPLGMIDIIAPIKVKDNVIGVVITGQRIIDNEVILIEQKICEKYPDYRDEYNEAFQRERKKAPNKICSIDDIEKSKIELKKFVGLITSICEKVQKLEDEKKQRELLLGRIRHEIPNEVNLIQTATNEIKEYFLDKHKEEQKQKDNNSEFSKESFYTRKLSVVNQLALSNTRIELFTGFATSVNFTKEEILKKLKTLNLTTYINSMKDVYRTAARDKGIEISFKEPEKNQKHTIEKVSRFYELAIHNIIFNAIRYSRFGTCVEVIMSKPGIIEIVNYGIAIKEGDREKIYEESFRGSEAKSFAEDGLGFGLYLAKKVINAHDGHSLIHRSEKLSDVNCAGIDSFCNYFDSLSDMGWKLFNELILDERLKVSLPNYESSREKMKSISEQFNYDYKEIDESIVSDFVKAEFGSKKQIDFDEFQRLYLDCELYKTTFTIKFI